MSIINEFFQNFLSGNNIALMGAVLAALLACIGSARGVGIVGEAASGLLAEDPTKFGQATALQVLPGSQGIYGFITAFLILLKLNIFGGGGVELTVGQGAYLFMCALPIAIVGYFSAIAQGKVCVSGIGLIARREGQLVKAITSAAIVETYALFALLVSVLPIISFAV